MAPFHSNRIAMFAAAFSVVTAVSAASADENVMVVFDGSNSMWGQIEGTAKIEIARDVMDNLLGEWVEEREVGLMAYGHRNRGDCTDIELLVEPGISKRGDILTRIKSITPTGKTPLTAAVEQAATALSYTDKPATVVLISDGLESCDRDPCALAEALEKGGVGFTAHVVGFGLGKEEDTASLSCIAEKTGGQYISASNAQELGTALSAVATAVAEPTPEPESEPEPAAPRVVVDGPDTAIAGSSIRVTWSPTVDPRDILTVAPVGSEPDTVTLGHRSAQNASEVFLTVPGDEGMYEVRYLSKNREVLGFDTLEATKAEVSISVPETATAGAQVKVEWTPTINSADYLTIVPAGSDPGTLTLGYRIAADENEVFLPIDGTPGVYEARYVLGIDKRTVAFATIEATEPNVTLQAPETALVGEQIKFTWAGTVNRGDYLTLVPAGTDEGSLTNYILASDASTGKLNAPSETGIYELRYVLRNGKRTVARAMIEVTDAVVMVAGPETVVTGANFKVGWTGTVNKNDYIAIVPLGAEAKNLGKYKLVRDKSEETLTAPAAPGLYELRYILREGPKVMATAQIEVVEPEVTLSGPESVATGANFKVSWTGKVNNNDYVAIVPLGAEQNNFGNYKLVRDKSEELLLAPAEPGLYELRYILREGSKVMATAQIEVTEPEVTISGPASAVTGSNVKVTWTGTVNKNDYVAIVPLGAEQNNYGNYKLVRDKSEEMLLAQAEPGLYELRYILREGPKVMATAQIELLEPEVTIAGPDTASTGEEIKVTWTGTVNASDYIAVVPAGSEPNNYGRYQLTRDRSEVSLVMPADPGLYELRYILREGPKVLASAMIEVSKPSVTLSAASELRTGDELAVEWTGAVSGNDFVTLVPMGAPDNARATHIRVRDKSSGKLKAPDETGLYELRYVLREGPRVLARQPVEVLAKDAALNTGAVLNAPDTASPGSTIDVSWQVGSTSADQRITLARGNQAIFTWLEAVKISGQSSVQLTMPEETGVYEIRFLDVSEQSVLARKVIKIE